VEGVSVLPRCRVSAEQYHSSAAPGHIPIKNEPGTEFLWFSPSEELRTAEMVMMKNMQAMQDGSTP
jgi:hypothetical protein